MSAIKAILRGVTPPVLWEAAHILRMWVSQISPHATAIDFPDWPSAAKSAGSYEDAELTRFRAERSKIYAASAKFQAVENSPLFWLAADSAAPLKIVDFGGAFGANGLSFLNRFPGSHYTVVEIASIVSLAPSGPVSFSTEIPDALDVFYASGALQYLADPYGLLKIAFSRAEKAVVMGRTFFSEDDRFRVQGSMLFENGAGEIPPGFKNRLITYPVRTLTESAVDEIATKAGFSLKLRHAEPSDIAVKGIDTRLLVYVRDQIG